MNIINLLISPLVTRFFFKNAKKEKKIPAPVVLKKKLLPWICSWVPCRYSVQRGFDIATCLFNSPRMWFSLKRTHWGIRLFQMKGKEAMWNISRIRDGKKRFWETTQRRTHAWAPQGTREKDAGSPPNNIQEFWEGTHNKYTWVLCCVTKCYSILDPLLCSGLSVFNIKSLSREMPNRGTKNRQTWRIHSPTTRV